MLKTTLPESETVEDISADYRCATYLGSYLSRSCIVGSVDIYSDWPEAFAISEKSAATIAFLIIEEIFPRYGVPLEMITDNRTES